MDKRYKEYVTVELDPNLRTDYLHGVMGRVTPIGEIEMDFFYDTEDLPEPGELILEAGGTMVTEEHLDEMLHTGPTVRNVTRTIHTRTLLSVEQARSLAQWLLDKIDEAES